MINTDADIAVHFWVADEAIGQLAAHWSPDTDPERFSSGVGHALVELYARLRDAGRQVTIGPRVPSDADVVVWYPDDGDHRATVAKRWRVARHAQVLIRGDRDISWRPIVEPDVTVVPNRAEAWKLRTRGNTVFVPLLPQRGVIPRRVERFGSVSKVAFKGNPENVPDYLKDPSFISALEGMGLSLRLDVPTVTNGEPNAWQDFGDVDVTLCVRAHAAGDDLTRKPATKLINGWVAGAIPLIAPEPAYLELCTDGEDAVVADGPDAILDRLRALKDDHTSIIRMESAVRARGEDYRTEMILRQWEDLLFGTTWRRPTGWQIAHRRARSLPTATAKVFIGTRGQRIARSLFPDR